MLPPALERSSLAAASAFLSSACCLSTGLPVREPTADWTAPVAFVEVLVKTFEDTVKLADRSYAVDVRLEGGGVLVRHFD